MIIDLKMYPVCFPVSTEAPEPFRDGFHETLRQASTTSKLSRSLSRRAGAITTAQNNASIVAPPDNDTLQSQQVGNNLEAGYAVIARSVLRAKWKELVNDHNSTKRVGSSQSG